MEARSLEAVFTALNAAQVRYLVAGGLAVVKHGYRPRVPVAFEALADPVARESWVREKDMTVLGLFSDQHRLTDLAIFLANPIRFDAASSLPVKEEIGPGVPAIFVGIDDLLQMKRIAGRPKDLLDIDQLEKVRKLASPESDR